MIDSGWRLLVITGSLAAVISAAACGASIFDSVAPPPSVSPNVSATPETVFGAQPQLSQVQYEAMQIDQSRIDDWITQVVGPTYEGGSGVPGLGGVWMDPYKRTVSLAWKGPLPADVAAKVANPPSGVIRTTQMPTTG